MDDHIPFFERRQMERDKLPITSSTETFPKILMGQIHLLQMRIHTSDIGYKKSHFLKGIKKILDDMSELAGKDLISSGIYHSTEWITPSSSNSTYYCLFEIQNANLLSDLLKENEVPINEHQWHFMILNFFCKLLNEHGSSGKIQDINGFLKSSRRNYQFDEMEDKLIPCEDENVRKYFVFPVLSVLSRKPFEEIYQNYFQKAFDVLSQDYTKAVNEFYKGCEAIYKKILDDREVIYKNKDGYSALVDKVFKLYPIFPNKTVGKSTVLEELKQLAQLRNQGAHGSPKTDQTISEEEAHWAMHHALANAMYFVKKHLARKN